jgi:hypothetical protein
MTNADVPAHSQKFTHSYIVTYPEHAPRADDPHHADFEAWKRKRKATNTYYCDFANDHRGGDTSECDNTHPLEAHHSQIELAMLNEIDFTLLEQKYPGISNPDVAGAWIDSDANLTLYCRTHHRAHPGVHSATYSDFGSEFYIRGLIG